MRERERERSQRVARVQEEGISRNKGRKDHNIRGNGGCIKSKNVKRLKRGRNETK